MRESQIFDQNFLELDLTPSNLPKKSLSFKERDIFDVIGVRELVDRLEFF